MHDCLPATAQLEFRVIFWSSLFYTWLKLFQKAYKQHYLQRLPFEGKWGSDTAMPSLFHVLFGRRHLGNASRMNPRYMPFKQSPQIYSRGQVVITWPLCLQLDFALKISKTKPLVYLSLVNMKNLLTVLHKVTVQQDTAELKRKEHRFQSFQKNTENKLKHCWPAGKCILFW